VTTKNARGFIKNTKGAAGVHLVVAELSLRGYIALPTTRNLKAVDIVAFNNKLSRFAFIQVKSTDQPRSGWPVYTIKNADNWEKEIRDALFLGERFFYVFVVLPSKTQSEPVYYIVPSADVAEMLINKTREYLREHPSVGVARQLVAWGYGGLRPEEDKRYRNKWELLGLDETEPSE